MQSKDRAGATPVAAAADRDRGHPLVPAVLRGRLKSPVAEPGGAPIRRWTSWDILPLSTVDAAKSSLLHIGYGDFDGAVFQASADEFGRRTGSTGASLFGAREARKAREPGYPLGPRFAGPRAGAGGGLRPL